MTDESINNTITFFENEEIETFDTNFQNKFLKVFTEDNKGFVEQIVDVVFVDYFDSYQKIILNYQMQYYKKYSFTPDYEELKRIIKSKEKGMNREHLIGVIEKIEKMELPYSHFQPVKDHCSEYFKSRSIRNAILKIAKDWKTNNYESMKLTLEESLRAGDSREVGHKYFKEIRKRLVKDFRTPIPTLKGLSERMNGGLAAGELGVVLAPTGGGKSMALVRFAVEALMAGKKVLYYSFELSENVIGQRFDSCIGKIPQDFVWHFPNYIEEELDKLSLNGSDLVIKDFPTKKVSIDTLYSDVHSLMTTEDFVPDVIFVDYADLLKPTVSYTDKRHELTSIYEALRGFAGELQIPVWTASQTNREAMDKEKFGLSTIGESLGKAQISDIVIGVARPNNIRGEHRAIIGILKSRIGPDGFYLDAIFNTDTIDIKIVPPQTSGVIVPGAPPKRGTGVQNNDEALKYIEKSKNN